MANENEDLYRKFILPAMGIFETVATQGRSPGSTALQQENMFRQRDTDKIGREDAEQMKRYREAQIRQIESQVPESMEDIDLRRAISRQRLEKEAFDLEKSKGDLAASRDFEKQYQAAETPEAQAKIYETSLKRNPSEHQKYLNAQRDQRLNDKKLEMDEKKADSDRAKIAQGMEKDLIDEKKKDPSFAKFRELYRQNKNVNAIWSPGENSPERLGIIDQGLIKGLNLAIEPNSVVRDSEYAQTAQGQAVLAQIPAYIEKLRKGGAGIDNKTRGEIVRVVGLLYKEGENVYRSHLQGIDKLATAWDARKEVIYDPIDLEVLGGGEKAVGAPAQAVNLAQPSPDVGKQGQVQSFNSEQEAAAANLPKGTLITISGRKVVIE